jgi:uncharacterized membrane protein YagU involved in acid resistance
MHIRRTIIESGVGCISGALIALVTPMPSLALSVLLGGSYGFLFALLCNRRIFDTGSGLIWGLSYAFLLWLAIPAGLLPLLQQAASMGMLDQARLHFPELVAYILFLGVPLGLMASSGSMKFTPGRAMYVTFTKAIIIGGLAGLLGGWAFSIWFSQHHAFLLIAGIVDSNASAVGILLHYTIAFLIGASYGILFQCDVYSSGSGLCWGMAYGIFWWFLGPLTLLPLLLHHPVDWSYQYAEAFFGSLIGHIIYGILLGLVYSLLNRLWVGFFIESDPLQRARESVGVRTFFSLGWGIAASIVGGLLFSGIMLATGVLPRVAALVGGSSPILGFFVHLVISSLIGMSYGLLFTHESPDPGSSLSWGMLYGLVWWFIGPLTLMPILLSGSVTWTIQAADLLFPSLLGHIIYGAATGLVFLLLKRRYGQRQHHDKRFLAHLARLQRPLGTGTPALWLFALGLGILLPIILG